MRHSLVHRIALAFAAVVVAAPLFAGPVGASGASVPQPQPNPARAQKPTGSSDQPPPPPKHNKQNVDGGGDDPYERADWFYGLRAAGVPTFTLADAADARAIAAQDYIALQNATNGPSGPASAGTYGGAWTSQGPNPIQQVDRTPDQNYYGVSGRVGALAIRSTAPYTMYLGGAQGGIWISSTLTSQWTPQTDQLSSLAIGAIALAPSNEDVVYVGTGEGVLSGDSYFGNGVLKSIDAGNTFTQVSGSTFNEVSIASMVVDPTDPDIVYAATLAGVAGVRDVRADNPTPYGIWKSTDGGVNWTGLVTTTNRLNGATDLVIDPLVPSTLYASFLGQGISKTVDSGATWTSVMGGLPVTATLATAPTRFALGISHPSLVVSATLYTGFEWFDVNSVYHHSDVWKSTDEAASWSETGDLNPSPDNVNGYCDKTGAGSQCTYDNVIAVDPISPTIVYALGLFNYPQGSGGIYRSEDGGDHWVDIGYGLHPDYHAIAIRQDDPANIIIGNDGGVWASSTRGGRPGGHADDLSDVDWIDLNGAITPGGTVLSRTGLQISEFSSIGSNPTLGPRLYGGLQDNGTLRKSSGSQTWFDIASGDGGQVLVDPTDPNYIYGTYPGLAPYRFSDDMAVYLSNASIANGIDQNDQSAFYIPWVMDPANPNRLYLGSVRIYRTDNAKDPTPGNVLWQAISPDLTDGCPNRNTSPTSFACVVTAIGATAGGPFVYAGTGDGNVWLSKNATSDSATWTQLDPTHIQLPLRPISAFAVDRSNYRIAYVAFSGYDLATPFKHGHVFKTTDGGQTWTNISSNLPDVPVNTLVLDPSDPNSLYVGTDVGPLVTNNGGTSWEPLGTGFPIVTVAQIDVNPYLRQLTAASYGRGVFTLDDSATNMPAMQIAVADSGTPVGPGTNLVYNVTVENHGNITATTVVITDPIPANTSFVSAGSGGTHAGGNVVWTVPNVPPPSEVPVDGPFDELGLAPGSVTVSFTVHISTTAGLNPGDVITNDGSSTLSSEGPGASGSPQRVVLAPANSVAIEPPSQVEYARAGKTTTYTVSVHNLGFNSDNFALALTGNAWPTTLWNASFTTPVTQTGTLAPGASFTVGIKVSVPAGAAGGSSDTASLTATSHANPSVHATATLQTFAVTKQILLVDEDGDIPDVQSVYTAALDGAGASYDIWDLAVDPALPLSYMTAHQDIIWFTGQSYPDPLGAYEDRLAAFLDNGGRLFLSGQDILDQAAGTAPFVSDYLHENWDGTESHNDIGTDSVSGVVTNPVTSGIGNLALNFGDLGYDDFADALDLINPALPAFTGTYASPTVNVPQGTPDGLSVDTGTYKVVFLAFPFEVMGDASDQADVMGRVLDFFGPFPPSAAQLSTAAQSVNESVGSITVTVQLDGPSAVTVTVPYTASGSATAGSDFTGLTNGSFVFAPGVTSVSKSFHIVDDAQVEPSETIIITLGNPTNATLGSAKVETITILDNDVVPNYKVYFPLVQRTP
jgi:uncharacterized repeat protein (TIGR01451 family)